MRIISYNVNGLRAAFGKGFADWLKTESPDILCVQETKAQHEQIDTKVLEYLGYNSYIHSAEKKGYSGVALFSKMKPKAVTMGMGIERFDSEGRILCAHFDKFSVISTYIPSGTTGDERQDFKMEFLDAFYRYIAETRKVHPNLVVSGDYNICHKPIDINHPKKHEKMSGFLPDEREWFDKFIEMGLIDTFRVFNQQADQYSWWSYRANSRAKNLGWRIDYHIATETLRPYLLSARILNHVEHSDHCPVEVTIDI
ncbi:MAG: exodeoxyribonuclease III [Bacteroidales bacterium]|nr:exodeoxyribonuclease III [Bacteroidales bacterium]